MITVTPVALISRTRTKTSSCRAGLSPALGSSRSRTLGFIMSARPMATIWRSPPESEPARCLRRVPRVGKRDITSSKRSVNDLGSWKAPICMFSSIVSEGKTLFVWGTKPTPRRTSWSARRLVMSSSRNVTEPELICTSPNRALSRVDLPAPLGPIMPTNSPSWA